MPEHSSAYRPWYRRKRTIIIALAVLLGGWGIVSRIHAATALHHETEDAAITTVRVLKASTGPASEEIELPGTVQAWHEAPIFARTNGYLKRWVTDIGAHVKTGDLLAEIDTPDVDAQFKQAQADLATAIANNELAQVTAKRWVALLKTNSVSQQETDEKTSDAKAKAALVASARANLDRLRQLEDFRRLVAPFDGVVTARNTDTGALINAGGSSATSSTVGSQTQELFHVAELDKLRVYVQVPENYAPAITSDIKAELRFPAYPRRVFTGRLTHSAHALDPTTRTLLVELMVDNSKGELLPGGYVQVHLRSTTHAGDIRLPVNALIFRAAGLQVATVDTDGKAVLKKITIARDFGNEVEVDSGVAAGENVIINPPDSLTGGQKVRVAEPAAKDEKQGEKAEPEKP